VRLVPVMIFQTMTYAIFFLVAAVMLGGAVLLIASGVAERFDLEGIDDGGPLDD